VSDIATPGERAPCGVRELCWYFARLGSLGFGGPIALASAMHRDLVEERRWITEREYKDGLALAQLAPGPLAAQLCMYLGWVRGGIAGATAVSLAFIAPSFLMVIALSVAYVHFHGIPGMQGVFYGIGAAVIAIIARGAYKLAKTTVGRSPLLWGLLAANAALTAATESEVVWAFLGSGILALLVKRLGRAPGLAPAILWFPLQGEAAGAGWSWLWSGLHGAAAPTTLWSIATFFGEAGAFVFGSGLAIVPFLYGGVVEHHHWLTQQQFLDAVAVAMITPGPVVITVAFIGYLTAGLAGACVAAFATFLPCYLFTVIPAPYFQRFAKNPMIHAFVEGVTAAAAGAIAGAAFVLGRRALVDAPSVAIAAATLLVLVRFRKFPEPALIGIAGVVGLLCKSLG
jgi:chromate transporter